MAHIFKQPSGGQKGIVIFTHKEMRFFYSGHPYFASPKNRVERITARFKTSGNELDPTMAPTLKKIKEKYFIGVHFGWIHENFPSLPLVDFYMGGPTTVSFENKEEVYFIPLDGSSFIPAFFHIENPKAHAKLWDVIMVARDTRWKNIDKFLHTVRKLYDNGSMLRVLLIVPSGAEVDSNPKVTYTELLADYDRMFTYTEREHFTILKTHPNMPFLGLAQKQVAHFYHLSKVFTLYSEAEGGSRVISEALLAGLPVVVKSNLSGGGRDFLDDSNAVFFDEFEQADQALIKAVENWKTLNTDNRKVRELTHEDDSLEILKGHFQTIYQQAGQDFDGQLLNTDRLSFRLNAHWHEGLSWADSEFISPDIFTQKQFDLFVSCLNL